MKTILFLSKGEDSSSTRYRALQYFPMLEESGLRVAHTVVSGGLLAFLRALRGAAAADVVVVLRKTFPAPLLWLLRHYSRRLVFDFDDAIFCATDGSSSATRMRRFSAMVRVCDHVFAGNEFLQRNAQAFNKAVTLLPTSVAVDRYLVDIDKPVTTIDLVWIGSSSTRKYLIDILPSLRAAALRVPGLRLKIIADFDLPDAGFEVVAVPWCTSTEAFELASSHIGIAPMRDDDWSRGKCALKVLQYMAAGLPVVSANCGVNAEIVEDGVNGFLVSRDQEWGDRIVALSSDARRLYAMGEAGREKVLASFDIPQVCQRMRSVFETLLRD